MAATPEAFAADVTRLLNALQQDAAVVTRTPRTDEDAFAHVYASLKHMAHKHRSRWRGDDTLNTTALVHEAYLKLAACGATYESRTHFLAVASRAMRQLLINYAEQRRAQKRGGGRADVPLDEALLMTPQRSEELLALDEALKQLETMDQRAARVVECRVFGGLSAEETAAALGITRRTVSRDWSAARTWLYGALQTEPARPAAC